MSTVSNYKQLSQRLITTTGDSVLYTCPDSSTTTYVKNIFISNTSGSSQTWSFYVNQNGKVSGDQFSLWKTISIAANTTTNVYFSGTQDGIILNGVNASIIAKAGAINVITITLYGIEVVET